MMFFRRLFLYYHNSSIFGLHDSKYIRMFINKTTVLNRNPDMFPRVLVTPFSKQKWPHDGLHTNETCQHFDSKLLFYLSSIFLIKKNRSKVIVTYPLQNMSNFTTKGNSQCNLCTVRNDIAVSSILSVFFLADIHIKLLKMYLNF